MAFINTAPNFLDILDALAESKKELAESKKRLAESKKRLAESKKRLAESKKRLAEVSRGLLRDISEVFKMLSNALSFVNKENLMSASSSCIVNKENLMSASSSCIVNISKDVVKQYEVVFLAITTQIGGIVI